MTKEDGEHYSGWCPYCGQLASTNSKVRNGFEKLEHGCGNKIKFIIEDSKLADIERTTLALEDFV